MLFHGFIAVAPLKQMQRIRLTIRHNLFHGFIAVAPLKPVSPKETRLLTGPLPRLHRRGPIEAAATTSPLWSWVNPLPRLHRRGPIEATPKTNQHGAETGTQLESITTGVLQTSPRLRKI